MDRRFEITQVPAQLLAVVTDSATTATLRAKIRPWFDRMGPYSDLPHGALRQWCEDNGHKIARPSWELYGDWSDDPAELRTDLYYLLAYTRLE